MLGRREDTLKEAASEILSRGGKATYAVCDVRDARSVKAAADHVRGEFGRVDILVNNAGGIPSRHLLDIDEAQWRAAWDLKVYGYINLTREIYGAMRARRAAPRSATAHRAAPGCALSRGSAR